MGSLKKISNNLSYANKFQNEIVAKKSSLFHDNRDCNLTETSRRPLFITKRDERFVLGFSEAFSAARFA